MRWLRLISKNTDVKITVTTVQHAEGECERFESSFDGTASQKNGTVFVSYNDGEPNILTIRPDTVRITKTASGSAMTFEQGKEHMSAYFTPMGKMSLCVFTRKLLNTYVENGRVFIKYKLTFNETLETENDITIKIEEK